MNRKRMCLVIVGLILQVSLLASCQSTIQPTTPIPNQSPTTEVSQVTVTEAPQVTETEEILPTSDWPTSWSENFEDENLEGWVTWSADGGFFIENGILTSSQRGDLSHPSPTLFGTWSFDLYINANDKGSTHEFRFTEGIINFQNLEVKQFDNTQIWITTQKDDDGIFRSFVDLGEKIDGWHHFDITKSESGLIKVSMDGEFLLGHFDERSFDSETLVLMYCCQGPVLDNLEVQDQVIEIP